MYTRLRPKIAWDGAGHFHGVSITHVIDGRPYTWKIPHNGVVTQAMAADILSVSLMSVNNWVRLKTIASIKPPGQPSVIPLSEIKRVKKVRDQYGRLRRDALGS